MGGTAPSSGGASAGGIASTGGTEPAAGATSSGGSLAGGGTEAGGTGGTAGSSGCDICAVRDALLHRYSFDGTGTTVVDSVGGADGTVIGTELSGSGTLVLTGGTSDEYVDLPNGLISGLSSATLEVWVSWQGGNAFQRILDFGSNSSGTEGEQGQNGTTFVLISPSSSAQNRPRATCRTSPTNVILVDGTAPMPIGELTHLAAVLDSPNGTLSFYMNGALIGQRTGLGPLSAVNDINNWLGRSQFVADPEFGGTYEEVRIYGAALTASQIQASYQAGPNATLEP